MSLKLYPVYFNRILHGTFNTVSSARKLIWAESPQMAELIAVAIMNHDRYAWKCGMSYDSTDVGEPINEQPFNQCYIPVGGNKNA